LNRQAESFKKVLVLVKITGSGGRAQILQKCQSGKARTSASGHNKIGQEGHRLSARKYLKDKDLLLQVKRPESQKPVSAGQNSDPAL
jgi:hypothetical protein